MTDLASIIAKLEAGETGETIERAIHDYLGLPQGLRARKLGSDKLHVTSLPPVVREYTTSLDAALTLVPEGWRVYSLSEQPGGDCWFCGLDEHRGPNVARTDFRHNTPKTAPLALCIAALRARESSNA